MVAAFAAVQTNPGQLTVGSGGGGDGRSPRHFGKGPGLAKKRAEDAFRLIHADGLTERLPSISYRGGELPGPSKLHGGQFGSFADGVSDGGMVAWSVGSPRCVRVQPHCIFGVPRAAVLPTVLALSDPPSPDRNMPAQTAGWHLPCCPRFAVSPSADLSADCVLLLCLHAVPAAGHRRTLGWCDPSFMHSCPPAVPPARATTDADQTPGWVATPYVSVEEET